MAIMVIMVSQCIPISNSSDGNSILILACMKSPDSANPYLGAFDDILSPNCINWYDLSLKVHQFYFAKFEPRQSIGGWKIGNPQEKPLRRKPLLWINM